MGLIIAAAIATALAFCGLAILLLRAGDRWPLLLAFIVSLPLQPLAFYLVRLPLDGALKALLGVGSTWVVGLSLFYAPLTEEPAKWLTALVPAVRAAIARAPIATALAVGLGFGIGEIWFLAHAMVMAPNYPDAPFWMFSGFFLERLEVCFLHGAFVALPFVELTRRGTMWLGGIAGVALHFVLNFPIYLAQIDLFGLGSATWVTVLVLWIVVYVIACAVMLRVLARHYASAPPSA